MVVSAAIAQHSQTENDLYLDGTPIETRSAEYLHVFTTNTVTKHAAQIPLDELDDAHRQMRLAMLVGPRRKSKACRAVTAETCIVSCDLAKR
jgi:hypothetical protein